FQLSASDFTLIATEDETPILPGCSTSSRCSGGLPYGWKKLIYEAPLDLSEFANCLWTISFDACCRSNAIQTIVQVNQRLYTFCELNRCVVNSGPEFSNAFPYLIPQFQDFALAPKP